MIFSKNLLLSDDQAITADAASENVIDLGALGVPYGANGNSRDIGKGNKVCFLAQVTEDFNNLTSLTIQIQSDNDEGFGSPTTILEQTIALADLVAGAQFALDVLPRNLTERYFRVNYDVTGTAPTTGQFTTGVVMGVQAGH